MSEKTIERIKQNGEVFTPSSLVNQMLNKLPKETWHKGKTFCDPSCGDGQFLIWILLRKIRKGHDPSEALKTIYGAEIMRDNVRKCRLRLLKIIDLFTPVVEEHIRTVFQNIIWINQNNRPTGSLEYPFDFKNKPNNSDIERWMEDIYKYHALDGVDLPVEEENFTPTGSVVGEDMFEEI